MACDRCQNKLSDSQIAEWVGINMFPGDQDNLVTAVAVALAESGGCADCYNGTCCTGLFQINENHAGILGSPSDRVGFRSWLKDPDHNTRAARQVYEQQGWGAWEAYTNGSYRTFLSRAEKVRDSTGRAGPGGDLSPGEIVSDLSKLNPVDAFKALVQPLLGVAEAVLAAARWLSDRDNWGRILMVGAGAALLVVGAGILARPVVEDVTKVVKP